jgi:hypothetical protein
MNTKTKTKAIEQEKTLDQAEALLKQVLDAVNAKPTQYRAEDRQNLMSAWVALNKVTLTD